MGVLRTFVARTAARRTASALLVLVALVSGCGRGDTGAGATALEPPDFRLPSLDGRRLGPADFRGQVTVLDFWATWCGPCHVQAEILQALHEEYAGRRLQILAVDSGEDEATVRSFLADRPLPYPVLLDEDEVVSNRLRVLGLPTLVVLDRAGAVVYAEPGIVPPKRLREIVDRAGA
jgi:thiol-disulfide isomerase/thioredoxin